MSKYRMAILALVVLGLAGCESMSSATQTFRDLNKILLPVTVLQKGS